MVARRKKIGSLKRAGIDGRMKSRELNRRDRERERERERERDGSSFVVDRERKRDGIEGERFFFS